MGSIEEVLEPLRVNMLETITKRLQTRDITRIEEKLHEGSQVKGFWGESRERKPIAFLF